MTLLCRIIGFPLRIAIVTIVAPIMLAWWLVWNLAVPGDEFELEWGMVVSVGHFIMGDE